MKLPERLAQFRAALAARRPAVEFAVDRPADPDGEWWIDLRQDGTRYSFAWRSAVGFGLFVGPTGYGDRPDEIHRDPATAAHRVEQILGALTGSDGAHHLRLRELRDLRGDTQARVAERLDVGQGVVSRLERRDDVKLSSLKAYVEAMGGRLETRVCFPEFDATFEIGEDGDADVPTPTGRRRR